MKPLAERPTMGRRWAAAAACLLALTDSAEELEFSHGISLLHGPGFEHFEYVNPDAPKGGMMTFSSGEDIRNFAGEFDNTVSAPPG